MKNALIALSKIGLKVCPFNKSYKIADASGNTLKTCTSAGEVILFAAAQTI